MRGRRLLLAVPAAILVAGCTAADTRSEPTGTTLPAEVEPIVLAISVDGLNPDALGRLGREGTPNLHRLIDEGASTVDARTAEITKTLPNHTGMLTGRAVEDPLGHRVTFNDDEDVTTVSEVRGAYTPSMFDVAHDHGLSTALLSQKDKFAFFTRSWDDEHGASDVTGADDGTDKIDLKLVGEDAPVVDETIRTLRADEADLVFLHLRAPDQAGHAHGWLGPEYLDAVESVDDDLGRILALVDASPDLDERLTLLLTADHGGPEGSTDHYDATRLSNFRVPFLAWGRGVEAGADLYALNEGRTDPGDEQPSIGTDAPPIRNLDLEATALRSLGLDPVPDTTSSAWPALLLR